MLVFTDIRFDPKSNILSRGNILLKPSGTRFNRLTLKFKYWTSVIRGKFPTGKLVNMLFENESDVTFFGNLVFGDDAINMDSRFLVVMEISLQLMLLP